MILIILRVFLGQDRLTGEIKTKKKKRKKKFKAHLTLTPPTLPPPAPPHPSHPRPATTVPPLLEWSPLVSEHNGSGPQPPCRLLDPLRDLFISLPCTAQLATSLAVPWP